METAIKNRNKSFFSQIEKFGLRKRTMYKLFKSYGEMTDDDLSKLMRLPINSITGRRRELAEIFFVKAIGTEQNPHTGKPNTIWIVTTPNEREELIKKEIKQLMYKRFVYLTDLEIIILSELTKKYLLKKINKITELINKLQLN